MDQTKLFTTIFSEKKEVLEEKYIRGLEQGRREGAQNMLRELVGKKLIQGVPIEEISDMFEISIPQTCALIEEIYEVGFE